MSEGLFICEDTSKKNDLKLIIPLKFFLTPFIPTKNKVKTLFIDVNRLL